MSQSQGGPWLSNPSTATSHATLAMGKHQGLVPPEPSFLLVILRARGGIVTSWRRRSMMLGASQVTLHRVVSHGCTTDAVRPSNQCPKTSWLSLMKVLLNI